MSQVLTVFLLSPYNIAWKYAGRSQGQAEKSPIQSDSSLTKSVQSSAPKRSATIPLSSQKKEKLEQSLMFSGLQNISQSSTTTPAENYGKSSGLDLRSFVMHHLVCLFGINVVNIPCL